MIEQNQLILKDPGHLPDRTFDGKHISANSNLNSNSKSAKIFWTKFVFWASVQIRILK